MNRFVAYLRLAAILLVAVTFGYLSTLVPSPYEDSSSHSVGPAQEASAADAFHETIHSGTSDFQGFDVDEVQLASFSETS